MYANSKKAMLLQAAARIVRRDGVSKLTQDALAEEAGVSKGGVLYHFPSKYALIAALAKERIAQFEGNVEASVAQDDQEAGRWTRAYVRASAETQGDGDPSVGLLAAAASDPAVMEKIRERFAEWQARVETDGIDEATATLLRLAADGLWLTEMLGLAPPAGELRERVVARMLELSQSQEGV
ncbi:MAG: TetR/AcrR family transcriptional regulator [Capsulimonas sp.]|uniref:TetR/AcrR family transcriptional regulator n=1 Tax=Capsulimonas sp. TaxID=2494211 RepID=UPI00326679B8